MRESSTGGQWRSLRKWGKLPRSRLTNSYNQSSTETDGGLGSKHSKTAIKPLVLASPLIRYSAKKAHMLGHVGRGFCHGLRPSRIAAKLELCHVRDGCCAVHFDAKVVRPQMVCLCGLCLAEPGASNVWWNGTSGPVKNL